MTSIDSSFVRKFAYEALSTRVIFGFGTAQRIVDELDRIKVTRALVLSTPRQLEKSQQIAASLGSKLAGTFSEAVMHTPVDVTEKALRLSEDCGADVLVSVGGGSTIGLGKAIALRTDLPQVVVPTTYAGSEMTPILGETKDGVKTTQRTLKVLPEVVIYDVEFTFTLPIRTSVTSGMNAIAHAVEALYARDGNPLISLMAEEAIRSLAEAMPKLLKDPLDHKARSDALYGAWLCGMCLGAAGMALHHKLCHTLGGSFGLPHAETHSVVLPHATAYNSIAAQEAMSAVARGLRSSSAADGLFDLAKELGAPMSLRELGFSEADIERAAAIATKNPYWNPRPVETEAVRGLLVRAWRGERPRA